MQTAPWPRHSKQTHHHVIYSQKPKYISHRNLGVPINLYIQTFTSTKYSFVFYVIPRIILVFITDHNLSQSSTRVHWFFSSMTIRLRGKGSLTTPNFHRKCCLKLTHTHIRTYRFFYTLLFQSICQKIINSKMPMPATSLDWVSPPRAAESLLSLIEPANDLVSYLIQYVSGTHVDVA